MIEDAKLEENRAQAARAVFYNASGKLNKAARETVKSAVIEAEKETGLATPNRATRRMVMAQVRKQLKRRVKVEARKKGLKVI
jgi:hypothetical protein